MVLAYLTVHLKENKFDLYLVQYIKINVNAYKIETVRLFDEIMVCEIKLRMTFLSKKEI